MNSEEALIALVTAPDMETARKLAREALERRLAACVNLVPSVESHYWWNGKLDCSGEILLVIKTNRQAAPGLEKAVLDNHPYDTPELILLPIAGGNDRYLRWWMGAMVTGERPIE